ncbi:MAG TPA: hypothetical protein VLB12_07870 [Gemmatimonadales bacterium]|nr:hypothetical protein [Gemmatimonadales bacterium]
MPPETHLGEVLQDLLDGRLGEAERSRAEVHLAGCIRCRRELEALRWVKSDVLRSTGDEPLPPALAERVRAGLDAVDAESKKPDTRPVRPVVRWAVAAGIVAVAALAFMMLRRPSSSLAPDRVAQDFTEFVEGRLPLDTTTSDPHTLESFLNRNGVGFPLRIFDLGMMRYTLVGGRVQKLTNRAGALFVYRGEDDGTLICEMHLATLASMPPAEETRVLNGIQFHIYRRGGTTLVYWQEGGEVCVLVGDAPYETVIELAAAKAVKV